MIVKQFVDYSVNSANDTGENLPASIQPIADGNAANAANLGRPDESLRQRTEALRGVENDTLYLRDADRGLVIAGPGKVTWPGSTTVSASGIPSLSDVLFLLPMLTPGAAQTSPIPPVASALGTLSLKRADSTNSILVTSQRRSYAAGDQISIDVVSGGSFSCTLDAVTGFQRTIHIVATGATTLSTVISALNAITPGAPDNTALVTAALEGGASGSDLLLTTQAKQFVAGNYDGEGHTITPANLTAFFTGNPTQALAEGDTLCIVYAQVSDPASTGGRRQAIPENSNTAVPVGSFFNSRVHPEQLVNALPICKVINGSLVFATGVSVGAGTTSDLSGVPAADVAYAGGGNWADGTTNPATTVQAQLTKIVSDLAGGTGTAKLQGASSTYLSNGTLAAQLLQMANFVHSDKALTETSIVPLRTFNDWQNNARSLVDHMGYPGGQISVLEENWNVEPKTINLPISAASPDDFANWSFTGQWSTTTAGTLTLTLDGFVPDGAIVTDVVFSFERGGSGDLTVFNWTPLLNGSGSATVTKHITSGTGNLSTNLMTSPLTGHGPQPVNLFGDNTTVLAIGVTTSTTFALNGVTVTYLLPPPGWQYSGSTTGKAATSDTLAFASPDASINHPSVQLITTGAASTDGASELTGPNEGWFNTNTAYAVEFMVRTGTITDGANAAAFVIGLASNLSQTASLEYDAGTANWVLSVTIASSVNKTATSFAVIANTVYRVRLEVYGVARNSTGQSRVVLYINGVKAAEDATRTFTDDSWFLSFAALTTANPAGAYDFRIGRVRRKFNHLAASDAL